MVSKKFTRVLLLAAAVAGWGVAGPALAQSKIGFVNINQLLDQAPQAKAAAASLQAEFAPRQQKLMAEQNAIEKLEKKLARNSAVMSTGQRDKLKDEIAHKKREFVRSRDQFEHDLDARRTAAFSKLRPEFYGAISALAKKGHYDLVMGPGGSGVLYVSDRVNITKQVLARLKASYKAPKSGSKK